MGIKSTTISSVTEQGMLDEVARLRGVSAEELVRMWVRDAYLRVFYPEVIGKCCPLCKKNA